MAWAIEGTRHYGLGLARYLAGHGRQVAEIDATRHVARRRAGKSDRIDAVRAARELLARPHPAQMRGHGACAATPKPRHTSSAAAPKERPTARSAAASSATSPGTSSALNRLDTT